MIQEPQAQQVLQAQKVMQAKQVQPAPLEQQDRKDLKVIQDQLDRLALKVIQDQQGQQVQLGPKVIQEP